MIRYDCPKESEIGEGDTFRIKLFSQLEGIRIRKIGIGGRNSQDNRIGLCDVMLNHLPDLLFNVGRLISYGNLLILLLSLPSFIISISTNRIQLDRIRTIDIYIYIYMYRYINYIFLYPISTYPSDSRQIHQC